MFNKKDEMGYDSAITIFSPEGRLFQVEYAIEAVRHGSPIVGIKAVDGVTLVALKRETPKLMDEKSTQKIFRIDDHIGAAISGLHADARIVIDYARVQAQIERLTYGEPILIETLVKKISDKKQVYTQQAGIRPFGVSLLIAGVDEKGPQLYSTDPSGTYYGWKASVIGRDGGVRSKIKEQFKEGITVDEAINLSIGAISESGLVEKLSPDQLEVGVITVKEKVFKCLSKSEIGKFV